MDLKGSDPHNILSTLACVNDKNTEPCNAFNPLKQYKLYGENPATNKPFTEEQRENKKRAFKNKCGLNNNKIVTCCSPDDTNLGSMADFVKMEVKDKLIRKTSDGDYFVCAEDSSNPECRVPTAYDLCKLSSPEISFNTLENGEQKVSGAAPDCFKGVCASTHDLSYLNDPDMKQFYTLQDSEILTAIQKNNANEIKDVLKDQRRISEPLTVGYEGNTMLHHAVLYDADDIITLLLAREVPLDSKNKDGNTPLHLAALKGNSARLHQMIKMGGDTEIKNNIGDTVLFSAVRSADYPTVHVVLQLAAATPVSKNRLGETPLHVALISPKKNIDIVKLLVNKGVELYEKNNNGDTAMKTLQYQRRTKQNEEIRTYLMNLIIKKEGKNFVEKVKEYPELANFQVLDKEGNAINLDHLNGLEGIEVSLPDQYLPDNLQFTESNDYKYKVLTDEEKMQGNEINPLNDVNYFDRGAPDNAIDTETNSNEVVNTTVSNSLNSSSNNHSHFSKENQDILNRLIDEARNESKENGSVMNKLKNTLFQSDNNKNNEGGMKKETAELEALKVRVEKAKRIEQQKLAGLVAKKQKLLKELEKEQDKGTLAKLFGGSNEENITIQLNVLNQNITNTESNLTNYQNFQFAGGDIITDSMIAGENINIGPTTIAGGNAVVTTMSENINVDGDMVSGNQDKQTAISNDGDITVASSEEVSIGTNENIVEVNGGTHSNDSDTFKNMYEHFTIIPKAQNRFYMFALLILVVFFVIALLGSKKLI